MAPQSNATRQDCSTFQRTPGARDQSSLSGSRPISPISPHGPWLSGRIRTNGASRRANQSKSGPRAKWRIGSHFPGAGWEAHVAGSQSTALSTRTWQPIQTFPKRFSEAARLVSFQVAGSPGRRAGGQGLQAQRLLPRQCLPGGRAPQRLHRLSQRSRRLKAQGTHVERTFGKKREAMRGKAWQMSRKHGLK